MRTFLSNNFNGMNLEYTPHTKALLEIYSNSSDEEIVVTTRFLKSELIRLFQTLNLVDLIFSEYMKSSDYDGQAELSLEEVNLNYTPHTKHLLKLYISNQFEGTIEPTPVTLKEVLLDLHKNDRHENIHLERDSLGSLFVQEWICSPGGIELCIQVTLGHHNEGQGDSHLELKENIQLLTDFDKLRDYSLRMIDENFPQVRRNFKFQPE